MSVRYLIVAAIAVCAASARGPAADKPAVPNKLAPLERFAGEWVVDGKWSDGSRLHARNIYEWGLGKKIMKTRTFVQNGASEYQRYEGILAWHPEKKCIFQIYFAFDGSMRESVIEAKDKDTLHIGWVPFHKKKPSPVRQVVTFLDKDSFRWVVSLKDGKGWKQLIYATWKRKKS
jgi:hypothetical protein